MVSGFTLIQRSFKYIPNLSKTTKAEKGRCSLPERGGIEQRNLRAFLLGCIGMLGITWIAMRFVMAWHGR